MRLPPVLISEPVAQTRRLRALRWAYAADPRGNGWDTHAIYRLTFVRWLVNTGRLGRGDRAAQTTPGATAEWNPSSAAYAALRAATAQDEPPTP